MSLSPVYRAVTFLIAAMLLFAVTGCQALSGDAEKATAVQAAPTVVPEPQPTKFVAPPELLASSPEELCARLSEIKVLPHKDPNDTDPIFEALMAKGKEVHQCLSDKISDSTPMVDPRRAPHWRNYKVGDTAVFVLVRSIQNENPGSEEDLLVEMLPHRYQKEWKTNGIYAYFNYVSEAKNRQELQRWWKNWLAKDEKRR